MNIHSLVATIFNKLYNFLFVFLYICVRNICFCTQEYTSNPFKARIAILDGGIV